MNIVKKGFIIGNNTLLYLVDTIKFKSLKKMKNVNNCILHLSLIDDVGATTIKAIIQYKPTSWSWDELYQATHSDLISIFGLSQAMAQKVYTGLRDEALLAQELALIDKHSINWLTILDQSYPALLAQIYAPPAVLYWRGAEINADHCIAIVGSRKANYYGQRVINQLVPEFVAHGFTIVSGGALGADSMAHQATITAGGKTIVVLGSGLLQPYPHSNRSLFDAVIANGGTIMSSFPLQMMSLPGNFPARNRIVAGLSDGCVVIQAAQRSGASITANYALEQGREVFAVPGPIDDDLSVGCHALIQQGATLVSKPQDVLDAFAHTMPNRAMRSDRQELQQQLTLQDTADTQNADNKLTDDASMVMQICRTPCAMDELVNKTGFSLQVLQDILFTLQLDGKIEQDFSGLWNVR